MKTGNRGNSGITGVAAVVGAVLFFSVLYVLYTGVSDVSARSAAVRQAADVAAVLDSVGASSDYCEATYTTPPKLAGREYMLHVSGGGVTISLSSPPYNASSILYSRLSGNYSAPGGANLTIIKDNGILEVT